VELWEGSQIIQEGFTPFSANVSQDLPYEVFIYDDPTESKFFDHWEDGTTLQRRSITLDGSATLKAFFNFTIENQPPVGANDHIMTQKNQPVTINVLANDSDYNNDPLTVSAILIPPQNGTATINQNSTITYWPVANFVGNDSFYYELSDGAGGTDTAAVLVMINGTATPSITANLMVKSSDMSGTEFSGQWVELWRGGGIVYENFTAFLATVDTERQYNIFIYDDPAESKFFDHWEDGSTNQYRTIMPNQDMILTAFFQIGRTNVPPVASNDTATTGEDTVLVINVLANDSDPDGDALVVSSVSSPANGTASVNANTITYTPNQNFAGSDLFRYTITDGKSGTDVGTVSISVSPVNDPPIAESDATIYDGLRSVTLDVLANDSDPDGDALVVSSVSSPANGTASVNANTITYTPNQNFAGSDLFRYTITDGSAASESTIYITRIAIEKTVSGLIASDPMNNVTMTKEQLRNDTRYWAYEGSANNYEPDAPFDFFQNSTGRYIGTQAPSPGTYAGWFAVSPQTHAELFHAVITTPVRTIEDSFFQNGLYVQTFDGRINYVTCVSITGKVGTTWHVIRTYGNFTQATQFETLWSDISPNQTLTKDCTIITNGDNYLKVYLDGVKVYQNNTIDLQMPGPFLYFLEPQNSYAGNMIYGIYNDYYSTKGEMLTVTNLPDSASKVQLVASDNSIISESPVDALEKTAVIDIGGFHFPISANLRVVDSDGTDIVSTTSLQQVYGGDTYSITYPSVWDPEVGTTWNVQIKDTVDQSFDVDMYDIDLFDNDQSVVDSLHEQGANVVCYVNVGSWEAWRSDAGRFPASVIGKDYIGFAGEKWLDINQIDVIGPIILDRFDLCKQKGFDGIDADNVESHRQDTGFAITYDDQIRFNKWLAEEAHKRGLSIGLKNNIGQTGDLVANFDWAVNEQCNHFNECHFLKPFTEISKPVFHIEYLESGQTVDKFCPESLSNKFSGILKSMNLTGWYEPCKINNATSALRISTELTNGTKVAGFFVGITYDNVRKTGFSPVSFEVPSGQTIRVQVSGFGDFVFDHWKDNGMTSSTRNVWLIQNSEFTAVYRDTGSP
jgi:hypothetical protein